MGISQESWTEYCVPEPESGMRIEASCVALLAMASCPEAEPEAEGAKLRLMVRDWPGDRVTGRVVDASVNSVPETVRVLMVMEADPEAVRTTLCVEDELTGTLPKAMEAASAVRVDAGAATGLICTVKVDEPEDAEAVIVTDWVWVTDAAVAWKLAVVEPEGTDKVAGTARAALLLASEMLTPPLGAAEVSVTVQLSEAPAAMLLAAQESALSAEGVEEEPLPLRWMTCDPLLLASVVKVS